QGHGQVGGDGGLAVFAGGRGDHDRLQALALGHYQHPGPQGPVGLGGGAVRPLRRVRGTVASTGARRYSSRSTRPRSRLSTRSRPKAMSSPAKRPKKAPRTAFVLGLGLSGAPGRLAMLTTEPASVTLSLAMSAR